MKGILASDTNILQGFLKKHHFRVSKSSDRFISYESPELTELLVLTGAPGERAPRIVTCQAHWNIQNRAREGRRRLPSRRTREVPRPPRSPSRG